MDSCRPCSHGGSECRCRAVAAVNARRPPHCVEQSGGAVGARIAPANDRRRVVDRAVGGSLALPDGVGARLAQLALALFRCVAVLPTRAPCACYRACHCKVARRAQAALALTAPLLRSSTAPGVLTGMAVSAVAADAGVWVGKEATEWTADLTEDLTSSAVEFACMHVEAKACSQRCRAAATGTTFTGAIRPADDNASEDGPLQAYLSGTRGMPTPGSSESGYSSLSGCQTSEEQVPFGCPTVVQSRLPRTCPAGTGGSSPGRLPHIV